MRIRPLLTVALVGLLIAGCSGDEPKAKPGIRQQRAEVPAIELVLTAADLVSPHQVRGPLDAPTAEAALKIVQQAFDATVVGPLRDGEAGSLKSVFTENAAARAAGADRGVLFDEGLGAFDELVADRAAVAVTGMHGATPATELIVAAIDWDVRSADGSVRVKRVGELSLVPVFGTWLVVGYSILTSRTTEGETTTTTAATP